MMTIEERILVGNEAFRAREAKKLRAAEVHIRSIVPLATLREAARVGKRTVAEEVTFRANDYVERGQGHRPGRFLGRELGDIGV